MKKNLLLISLFLAACGPVTPVAIPPTEPASTPEQLILPTALPTAAPQATPVSGGGYPAAAFAAQAHLAGRLGLSTGEVRIVNTIPRDWPDACLGVASAQEMCAQVITPGFEVLLESGGKQYTYHTDVEGKSLRPLDGNRPFTGSEQAVSLLEWTGPDCARLSVTAGGVFFGKCAEGLAAVPGLKLADAIPLKDWVTSFQPFEADTPAGHVKLSGSGRNLAGITDQRMLAEWARLQFEVAQAGRSGAAWGLAYSYHRQGGIAGFCDDLGVYLDGRAVVSNCKGLNENWYLTASEMEQVYAWYDGLAQVDYSHTDGAVADGMAVTLNLPGQGQKIASDAEVQSMLDAAAGLVWQSGMAQQAGAELPDAQKALVDYFTALNTGDFTLAAKLYGGPTDLLQTWNPDIKNDLPAWLERGCKQNGLVCMLPRSVRYAAANERGGYTFLVEFNNADGSLFVQSSCCGDTSGVHNSRFSFSVLRAPGTPGGWQVMDLPPYVP